MKNKYLLALLILITVAANAQIVNIPDANFKAELLSHVPTVDLNGDGQIQNTEAAAASSLLLNVSISDFTGLEAFTNLVDLRINQANVNSINLSMLALLETLKFEGWSCTSINTTGLSNLKSVDFSYCAEAASPNLSASANTLEHLDIAETAIGYNFSSFPNLKYLDCSGNGSSPTMNLTGLSQLEFLDCSYHGVNSIDLAGLSALKIFRCDSNALATLNLSAAPALEEVSCDGNNIATITIGSLPSLHKLILGSNELTSLTVSAVPALEHLDVRNNHLTALDLGNLPALRHLFAPMNELTGLDVSSNGNLENLEFSSNQVAAIDVSMLTHLKNLQCDYNNLTAIDVAALAELVQFNCSYNQIPALDLTNNPALSGLNCEANLLTALDVTQNPDITYLECGMNQISALDLSNAHELMFFSGTQNPFTSLDFSAFAPSGPTTFVNLYYDFTHCQQLTFVNLKHGYLPFIECSPWLNVPNLSYVCVDEAFIPTVQNQLANCGVELNLGSYCSFNPGGPYNTITGTCTYDFDNNGCSLSDNPAANIKISLSQGTDAGVTFCNTTGSYSFFTEAGSFTLMPVPESAYFTVTPPTATINFATIDESTQTQNFCISPNGIHKDLEVTIVPLEPARPGFDASYLLAYKNKGNQLLSGSVQLLYQDALLDLVSTSPAETGQSTDVLHWDFTDLLPFETREITLVMNVNSPLETPAVNIGDELNFMASVTPTLDDETIADNTCGLKQTVVGSFDPNDKTCVEGETISPQMVGGYLHYVIRFQNSGTFYAENVVVKDIIDPTKFDIATLQLIASSHPHTTRITGNKVEFIFEGINLPAEQDDEPGSHGYVAFKVRTKPTLALNDVVENTAGIFFDFNAPIVTNTATTTVSNLGLGEIDDISVSIAPNPVKNILTVSAQDVITSIQLFDLQGRLLQTTHDNQNTTILDFNGKANGVYFVKAYTDHGVKVQKVIKE